MSDKGRMRRVAFRNKPRMSRYKVECGSHGCATVAIVRDPADAAARGWGTVSGSGWVCPECRGHEVPA